jgi:Kef-type K+ transport system membrane component KefB
MQATDGWTLFVLGAFLLAAYLAHVTGPRISVPRVTLLLVLGAIVGPSFLDLVPHRVSDWFPFVAHMALAIVGFLLGERFVGKGLRDTGRIVLWVSIGETILTAAFVLAATLAVGASLTLALVLAGIAPASAPAAIFETVREGKAKGKLTNTVLGVVAVDDAWGVLCFSICLVTAQMVAGEGAGWNALLRGVWEVGGAAVVGTALALPMAWITGKVRKGAPTLVEAAGFVFLCAGAASLLHVSYLLAAMVMGGVLARFARPDARPFHAIEGVSEPFLSIFFVLAGLRLEIDALTALGVLGGVYVIARAAGLVLGGALSGFLAGAPPVVRRHIGWCILPQAGVALGFALLVQEVLPDVGETVLPLVIATTVLFALVGPLLARWNLRRAGELSPGNNG